MHIQLVQMFQKGSERGSFGHLSEGIHILGETLATIAVLAIRTRHVGVGVVDITRKLHACMYLAPVGTHLLTVFATGVEVGDLISTKHVMHVFGQLGLQRCHHCELLAMDASELSRQSPAVGNPSARDRNSCSNCPDQQP